MSAYSEIRAALETQIASVSGIPNASNRAWENVRFEPTTGTSWVRMTLSPLESRPASRGPSPQIRYDGLFLVDIFTPEGQGANAADVLADAVRDAFTVDDTYTSGSTIVRFEYAERSPGLSDSPWYQVPVVVKYYAYRAS